jgi:cytochrome c biogenesis protein CcmG, thiol:disulfide interchange protein DsbE
MKYPILVFLTLFFHLALAQKQEQPILAFPFKGLVLTTPDSIQITAPEVFKKGKPTVVAFWLTTCMPCIAEFGAYTKNWAQWRKETDFQLVAVSIDYPDRFKKIKPLVKQHGWPFPVYWDKARRFKDILPGGLNGLPQVFVFDKTGELVWQHKKYQPGDELELYKVVKKAGQ